MEDKKLPSQEELTELYFATLAFIHEAIELKLLSGDEEVKVPEAYRLALQNLLNFVDSTDEFLETKSSRSWEYLREIARGNDNLYNCKHALDQIMFLTNDIYLSVATVCCFNSIEEISKKIKGNKEVA